MGNYVAIMRFDEAAENRIINLRKRMEEAGCPIPEWPPHITLAAYENIDESLLCDWVSEFSAMQEDKIEIALHSFSILPPWGKNKETAVLCLNPAHSKPFVDFYYRFHEKHEEYCTGIGWYNSITHGRPVIHATLGVIAIPELQKAMELVFSGGVFGIAQITAIEVYTYPMRLIKRFELR